MGSKLNIIKVSEIYDSIHSWMNQAGSNMML